MPAKSEITIKFSGELPTATPAANKKVEISLTDQILDFRFVPQMNLGA
jgi:hypothetical protein